MREEVLVFCVMAAVVLIGAVVTKNRRQWSVVFLLLASVLGSLVSGMGIRVREIVEGPFGYLDSALSVASATFFVFMYYCKKVASVYVSNLFQNPYFGGMCFNDCHWYHSCTD